MSGNRTAIVFGGAGFIGAHLIAALKKTGDYARIVSADHKVPSRRIDGVDYVACDVREEIRIGCNLANAEIYNFAAVHTTPGHEDWEYFWTNILGAVNVCRFASEIGAARMMFTSSISVYGPSENPLDESGPFNPESAYGRSKFMAEKIHQDWRRAASGRKLVIVRPAVIFGPGERGNFTRLAKALKARRFFYPGRADTIKSCGYVGELVRSMLFAQNLAHDEIIYNFAYPERYTSRDICEAFNKAAGLPLPTMTAPLPLMLAGGFVFEILAALGLKTSINRARILKLVNSTNIVPKRLLDLGYTFDTDLQTALVRWRDEAPEKDFV